MGRRKIEIKAIKDDRNRSVTFLKRKGGLFKKAHELSVLCSVDVAVFVFGNNKKLYEYSSVDMRDLITRYQYHGGANEHKGPADFNGGNDDDDDEAEPSPPLGPEGIEPTMMPPQFHGAQQPQFQHVRHHTPSASPPIPNGAFPGHPHHPQRGHTPQPPAGTRPDSRNDVRRMTPGMAPQNSHHVVPYMPTPPIYNPPHGQQPVVAQHGSQYPYPPPPPHQPQQQPPQAQPPQPQPPYAVDERRVSAPPAYSQSSQPIPTISRAEPSPPLPVHHHHQSIPQISTTPPQPERRSPQPPPPVEPRTEQPERPQPPLLNTDTAIKKLPQRKSHSIFTPIEENRSILSQHLASFASDAAAIKSESSLAGAVANANRPHSVDVTSSARTTSSPPRFKDHDKSRTASLSAVPETTFTPPSRSNSFKTAGTPASSGGRARGPRLTVQIPDGGSQDGSATGGDSVSPRPADTTSQLPHRQNSVVLPPPSPSASALLSAGATGPPNPFARPPPQSNNIETPASALPSRFLSTEFLPSPSSFYNDWNFRASNDNTLPSPLNFATPIASTGPSFMREENTSNAANASTKRKSPENGPADGAELTEAKRVKVE